MTDLDLSWNHCEGKRTFLVQNLRKIFSYIFKKNTLTHAYEVQNFIVSELL